MRNITQSISLLACVKSMSAVALIVTAQASSALTPKTVGFSACNSAVFSKIPGTTNKYLGRVAKDPSPSSNINGCPNQTLPQRYMPALYTHQSNYFSAQTKMLNGGETLADGNMLVHGYDPYAFSVRGKRYAAFECDLGRPNETVGVCIGELSSTSYSIIPSKTRLFVKGKFKDKNERLSGSVPTVLQHNNRVYLYWTAVEFNADNSFKRLTTRGTELYLNNANQFVNSDGKTDIYADEADIVMDAPSGGASDMTDIKAGADGYIYALAHVGGQGCTTPHNSSVTGCYKLVVRKSASPLGFNVFGGSDISIGLPPNPSEYGRWIWESGVLNIATLHHPLPGEPGAARYYSYNVNSTFNLNQQGLYDDIQDYAGVAIVGEPIISRLYDAFLGRAPESQAVIQNWSNYLQAHGLQALVNGIALSSESNVRNNTSEKFVTACYNGVLGRPPENQSVVNAWAAVVNAEGKATALTSFVNSAESQAVNQY